LSGSIAIGDSARVEVAYRDPSGAYLAALREAVAARGIDVRGLERPTVASDTLFSTYSLTLAEILPHMQKPSQNQIAEIFFKTIALERTGIGTADSARRVIERQLAEWGADSAGQAVRDGSGLSRHDYVSPATIVRVLDAMRRAPTFEVFYGSLPIAGVDGTIRSRMKGTPAEGNLRAKTGFVDKARSLSGYVTTADGRLLIFSALCNNWTVSVRDVERVQDEIGVRLAAMRLGAARASSVASPSQ
jgi:D-alanyl-D-alanine carboxypeptidase/D-alanyl-D-alanine-endopeptidase (penicillin-binding protein 4)